MQQQGGQRMPPPVQQQPRQPQQMQQPQQPRAVPQQHMMQQPQQPRAAPQGQQVARAPAPSAAVAVAINDPAGAAAAPKKSGFTLPSTLGAVFGSKATAGGNSTSGSVTSGGAALTPAEAELARREAELKAREAKMAAKEQEVQQREREVAALGLKIKNWPFRRMPLYYHSIKDDIPEGLQGMVKKLYGTWWLTFIGLIWNVITVMVYWGESDTDQGTIWCWIFMAVGIWGSWNMWYHRFYKGARSSSSRQYLFGMVGFGFHLGVMLLLGLGVPGIGGGGLLVMLKAFAGGYNVSGIFSLITTGLFGINFFFSVYLFKLVRDAWRTGGGSEALKKDRAKLKMASKAGMAAV